MLLVPYPVLIQYFSMRIPLSQGSAHLVQILDDLPVGLQEAGFVVSNGMFLAEGFDDVLRFFQFVPGNGWEQMMLDLVVQAAIPEISDRMSFDIARTEYLLVQKV